MARYSSGEAGNSLTLPSTVVPGPPFTLAAWANVVDNGGTQHLLGISRTSSDNPFYAIRVRFDQPTKHFEAIHRGDAATPVGTAAASTAFPTGRWIHVAGVFAGSASRTAYVHGVNVATNTTAIGTTTVNQTTVMYSNRNLVGSFYVLGAMAHVAIWSAALTATEIAALASGSAPTLIRPSSLAAYWPLRGLACDRPEPDAVRRLNLAVSGTTWAPDPPACLAHPVVAPLVHPLLESTPPAWHSRPVPALPELPVAPQSSGRPKKWFPGLARPRLSSGS